MTRLPLYQRKINEAEFTGQNTVKNIEASGDELASKAVERREHLEDRIPECTWSIHVSWMGGTI